MCSCSPNTNSLRALRSHATPDRAPDHLADGTPAALREDLIALLGPTSIGARVTDLVKYAMDASPYRLFPQVVIVAESAEQIARVAGEHLDLYLCADETCEIGMKLAPRRLTSLRVCAR